MDTDMGHRKRAGSRATPLFLEAHHSKKKKETRNVASINLPKSIGILLICMSENQLYQTFKRLDTIRHWQSLCI